MNRSRLFASLCLAAATMPVCAFAGTVTKSATGSDLTAGASWGGTAPTSADVATWTSTSLGAGLTAATGVTWGSINITGATANIAISGVGTITTGDITLAGTKTLSIGNAIALSGNVTYSIADVTGNATVDATLGAISGTGSSITKTGSGTLQLGQVGAGTAALTGAISVSGGTLRLYSSSGNGVLYASAININGASTLEFSSAVAGGNRYDTVGKTFTFDSVGGGAVSGSGSNLNWLLQNCTFVTTGGNRNTIGGTTAVNLNTGTATFNVARGTDATSDLLVSVALTNSAGLITKSGSGILTLTGANNYTGVTTITGGTFEIGGAGQLLGSNGTYSGAISNAGTFLYSSSADSKVGSAISGTGTLTKTGSGILTLSGTNNSTGTTNINGGVLSITATGALNGWNTNGRYTVANGATLAVGNAVTDANIVTMLGTTNFAAGSSLGFDTTTADRAYTANRGDTAQGMLGLTKIGANMLTLSGANNYTGITRVLAGTLAVTNTGALPGWDTPGRYSVANGATLVVSNAFTDGNVTTMLATGNFSSGSIFGFDTTAANRSYSGAITGALGLAKLGTNTLALNSTTSHTGLTDVRAGTLAYGIDNALSTGAVQVSGGTLDISTYSDTVGAVTLVSGSITGTTGVLTGSSYSLQAGTVSAKLGGTGGVTKSVGGTLAISGANTYTGGTNQTNGTINVSGDQSAATGGWNVDGTTAGATLNFLSGSTIVVDSGKSVAVASGSASGRAPTINVAGTVTNSGSLTVGRDGNLTVNSGGNWTQNGSLAIGPNATTDYHGTMIVSGSFTYAGSSDVSFLPAGSRAGQAKLTVSGGTFTTSKGFTTSTNNAASLAIITLSGGGTIKLSADVASLVSATSATPFSFSLDTGGGKIDTNNFNTTMSRVIGGAGSLTKQSDGTLTLSAANTYTGATVLSGGVLSVATIGDGGVAGNLGQATNAASNIVFDGGTLKYTGATATSNRAFTINATKAATIETANDLELVGATGVATTGALTKTGAGVLTLTGASTYTGNTTVSNGTLNVTGSLSDSTAVTVNGGTYTVGSTDTVASLTLSSGTVNGTGTLTGSSYALESGTVSAKLGGNGALTKTTSGTVTLSGDNSGYSGAIGVSAGTLTAGHANALGSGTVTVSGGELALGGVNVAKTTITVTGGKVTGAGAYTGTLDFGGSTNVTLDGTYKGIVSLGASATRGYTATNNFTVASGGTLQGQGTVNGNVTVEGEMRIGNSPGTLNVETGDVTLAAGSSSYFEIGALNSYDYLNVQAGTLTLNGTIYITAYNFDTTTLSAGSSFNFIDGNIAVGFDVANLNLSGAALASGLQWDTSDFASTGELRVVSAIPEPSTYGLLGAGALALATAVRRRRRTAR